MKLANLTKLFSRRPTAVPTPSAMQPAPDPMARLLDDIVDQLRAGGILPADAKASMHVLRVPTVPEAMLEHSPEQRPGIKPPSDPQAEGWTWTKWRHEMDINKLPGWNFCRFAQRLDSDKAEFVFGLVRGSFGIWQQPFAVCVADRPRSTEILTCLTHLNSGTGIGVFVDREIAAAAAELADKIDAWEDIDAANPATWKPLWDRAVVAWGGLGIMPSSNSHCHDPHTNQGVMIYGRSAESLMNGRPEKLS